MKEREGTQHPIKTIKTLTDQRMFLLRYAEGRTNTLNRIGVAPDVQVRVDPTAPLTEIHEKVLVPARRIQVAKDVVNRSLTKIGTEIHDIADKLEKVAPVFVAGVEQGREELDELAGYVEVGLVAPEVLEKMTGEYDEFTGLPEKHPPLRRGLELLEIHEKEVVPQTEEKNEEPSYELPNGKVLSGDMARLMSLLTREEDLVRGSSIVHSLWVERGLAEGSALAAVQQLIRHTRDELDGTGMTIMSKRGRNGGYYLATEKPESAPEEHFERGEEESAQETEPEAEEKDEVVVFEPAKTETPPQKDPEQLCSELLSREPQVEGEIGKYLLALEGRMDPRGYITVDALKGRFPHMEGFKLSTIKKNGIVELSPDVSTDSLDRVNAAALLYLSATQKEGRPLPKELQRIVPTVAKEVHEALLAQRARSNGTATSR